MLTGADITRLIEDLAITHVVWLPDSTLGLWEQALERGPARLARVCREGEAWAMAAGLQIAGARPLVIIQNTGLFESGDSLRNAIYDLGLPLWALIGYRSFLLAGSKDSARRFTEPVLRGWELDYLLVDTPGQTEKVAQHYRACRAAGRAGLVLLAEGKG